MDIMAATAFAAGAPESYPHRRARAIHRSSSSELDHAEESVAGDREQGRPKAASSSRRGRSRQKSSRPPASHIRFSRKQAGKSSLSSSDSVTSVAEIIQFPRASTSDTSLLLTTSAPTETGSAAGRAEVKEGWPANHGNGPSRCSDDQQRADGSRSSSPALAHGLAGLGDQEGKDLALPLRPAHSKPKPAPRRWHADEQGKGEKEKTLPWRAHPHPPSQSGIDSSESDPSCAALPSLNTSKRDQPSCPASGVELTSPTSGTVPRSNPTRVAPDSATETWRRPRIDRRQRHPLPPPPPAAYTAVHVDPIFAAVPPRPNSVHSAARSHSGSRDSSRDSSTSRYSAADESPGPTITARSAATPAAASRAVPIDDPSVCARARTPSAAVHCPTAITRRTSDPHSEQQPLVSPAAPSLSPTRERRPSLPEKGPIFPPSVRHSSHHNPKLRKRQPGEHKISLPPNTPFQNSVGVRPAGPPDSGAAPQAPTILSDTDNSLAPPTPTIPPSPAPTELVDVSSRQRVNFSYPSNSHPQPLPTPSARDPPPAKPPYHVPLALRRRSNSSKHYEVRTTQSEFSRPRSKSASRETSIPEVEPQDAAMQSSGGNSDIPYIPAPAPISPLYRTTTSGSNPKMMSDAGGSGGGRRPSSNHHEAASTTTSTSNSVRIGPKPFVVRNNRTYFHDPSLTYPLPVDLAELHRQSLHSLLLFQLFKGPIMSSAFEHKPPSRVLEVGCGSGFWSMMCHRYFSKHGHTSISFVGLDIAPLLGSDPTSKPDKDMRWRFLQHDMRRTPWPLPDGDFDLVMVKDMGLASTTGMQQKLMDEFLRVLRPGGVLEIWESDHTIRMLRPHVPAGGAAGAGPAAPVAPVAANEDGVNESDEEDDTARLGAYVMTPNTPLSAPLNPFLVEFNGWLTKALEARSLSPVPCALIGSMLLQESEDLMDIKSKRLAIPLSEIRWEREGVGGVVTKDGKSYIDSSTQKGKRKVVPGDGRGGAPKVLSPGQAALRRTALETVVGFIQSLEPLLRETSGKSQDEWDGWLGKMMNDLMKDGGTSWGECLEVGAWSARKKNTA